MNTIVMVLALGYLCWYTIGYARMVWKEGNKLGGFFVSLLALSLLAIPLGNMLVELFK